MEATGIVKSAWAQVTIENSDGSADVLYRALLPEAERPSSQRSAISLNVDGRRLTITVKASDVAALRATLNSYLRWANAIIMALDSVR